MSVLSVISAGIDVITTSHPLLQMNEQKFIWLTTPDDMEHVKNVLQTHGFLKVENVIDANNTGSSADNPIKEELYVEVKNVSSSELQNSIMEMLKVYPKAEVVSVDNFFNVCGSKAYRYRKLS